MANLSFAALPVFTSLSMELSEWTVALIRQELSYDPDPDAVYDRISLLIGEQHRPVSHLTLQEQGRLAHWFTRVPVRQMVDAIALVQSGEPPRPPFKPATPTQLALIREAQRELLLDLEPLFPQLSAWGADCLIKGMVVVSEVTRQTGDRHFHPRELRQAVRVFLTGRQRP